MISETCGESGFHNGMQKHLAALRAMPVARCVVAKMRWTTGRSNIERNSSEISSAQAKTWPDRRRNNLQRVGSIPTTKPAPARGHPCKMPEASKKSGTMSPSSKDIAQVCLCTVRIVRRNPRGAWA